MQYSHNFPWLVFYLHFTTIYTIPFLLPNHKRKFSINLDFIWIKVCSNEIEKIQQCVTKTVIKKVTFQILWPIFWNGIIGQMMSISVWESYPFLIQTVSTAQNMSRVNYCIYHICPYRETKINIYRNNAIMISILCIWYRNKISP